MFRRTLSKKDITRIMTILTLASPFGMFSTGTRYVYETIIYSFIYTIHFYNGEFMVIQILNPWNLFTATLIGMFTILFGFQVIRCVRNDTSKLSVYLAGILTLVIPIGLVVVTGIHDLLLYQGPIPIQMIVGVLITRSHKTLDKPWDDVSKDQHTSTLVVE